MGTVVSSILMAWDFRTFLTNSATTLEAWANAGFIVIGIVCLVVGVVMLVKNLMMHGKGQSNWIVTIGLMLVGGVLVGSSAYNFIKDIAMSSKDTINDLGGEKVKTVIIPAIDAFIHSFKLK